MVELLNLLKKFTFKQISFEGFDSMISVWKVFCEYLEHQYREQANANLAKLESYAEILIPLSMELFVALLWSKNGKLLAIIEEEVDVLPCFPTS